MIRDRYSDEVGWLEYKFTIWNESKSVKFIEINLLLADYSREEAVGNRVSIMTHQGYMNEGRKSFGK